MCPSFMTENVGKKKKFYVILLWGWRLLSAVITGQQVEDVNFWGLQCIGTKPGIESNHLFLWGYFLIVFHNI